MDQKYSTPEIENIMSNTQNQKCNDCDSLNPKWVSVNNAVFVCGNCAGVHRTLGNKISIIKSLFMDKL